MYIICSDLEGVWVPEVWINVALKTGIEELKYTTRDINDYDKLMQHRLRVLEKHGLTLTDIQEVISMIKPLEGALECIEWIKKRSQLIVVSDTFVEFADPLMEQLGRPTLLCHSLEVDTNKRIVNYNLRQHDSKRHVVNAFKSLNYQVIAFGDSYNDVTMLQEANKGLLFKPPENVVAEYPDMPVANDFNELQSFLAQYI